MSTLEDFVFVVIFSDTVDIRKQITDHGGIVLSRLTNKVKYAIVDGNEEDLSKADQDKIHKYKERNIQIVDSKWVTENFLEKKFDDEVEETTENNNKRVDDSEETQTKSSKRGRKAKKNEKVQLFAKDKIFIVGKCSVSFSILKSLIVSNGGQLVEDPDEATYCITTMDAYINKIRGLVPVLARIPSIPLYTNEYIIDKAENAFKDIKDYDIKYLYENMNKNDSNEKIVKITRRVDDLIPVDMYVPETVRDSVQVYVEDKTIWSAMLNQSDLTNNHNKFYLLQILQSTSNGNLFHLFFRWGRVGDKGQQKIQSLCLDDCKAEFEKKFFDKTANTWENRDKFKPQNRKYTYLKMKISKHDDKKEKKEVVKTEEKEEIECKLSQELQEAICLLYNIKQFNEEMVEEGLDINKMPLGELDSETITKGYKVLLSIEKVLKNNSKKDLDDLCSQFYTLIPHDFGRKHMSYFRIDNLVMLQRKIDLLSCLSNLKQYSVLAKKNESMSNENPLTIKYNNLRCSLDLLDTQDPIYTYIMNYANVRGDTHSYMKFHVLNIFNMHRLDEKNNITIGTSGNKRLLWHGTQLVNCVSILSRGLLIAPPEAQITGHMFGKGVYFADVISKSAQYCRANKTYPRCFMLLAEVDTGKEKELINADYNANDGLDGYDTVKGCGNYVPSKWTTYKGIQIPDGPLEELKTSHNLYYNEYIVYDTNRISLKYLVEIQFDY